MNTTITREEALFDLHAGVCKVSFTKVDGTERLMYATLKEDLLPEQKGGNSTSTPRSDNLVTVWDVEKNDFRSFRLDKVTKWDRMVTDYPVIDEEAKVKDVVFKSRYGDDRVLKKLSENTYSISGKSRYGRAGNNPNGEGLQFIDFEGGPFVSLGTEMSFFGAKDDRKISKVEFIPADTEAKDGPVSIRVTVA